LSPFPWQCYPHPGPDAAFSIACCVLLFHEIINLKDSSKAFDHREKNIFSEILKLAQGNRKRGGQWKVFFYILNNLFITVIFAVLEIKLGKCSTTSAMLPALK
jgi:hypothetical protein